MLSLCAFTYKGILELFNIEIIYGVILNYTIPQVPCDSYSRACS